MRSVLQIVSWFVLNWLKEPQQTGGDLMMLKLYRDLMDHYEKDIRPSQKNNFQLNVSFAFSLAQIIDVDEKNQILTTNAWINQGWIDFNLSWDPDKYNNITTMHIPHDKVWLPDIVLYNNADSNYNTALVSTDVFVRSNGNVTWLSGAIFKSSCEMNVRFYPFDEQECTLKFASWSYDGSLINLVANEKRDDSTYIQSSEWDLVYLKIKENVTIYSCCPDEPYPDVKVTLKISRKPMFYVFNLILPCVLITGIALLGFYMPSDSGEKVTLGITTLLSMTVFLMLVAESMPPTSDALPLIGTYYIVTITLVSFATAMTVFTLNIHHKGKRGRPVPVIVKIVTFKYLARILCLKLDPPDDGYGERKKSYLLPEMQPLTSECASLVSSPLSNGDASARVSFPFVNRGRNENLHNQSNVPVFNEFEIQFNRVLQKICATIEKNEKRQYDDDVKEAIKMEWQQVALISDRFLLLIFVFITTFASLLIMYQRELWFD